jgi:hypothetical protein
MCEVSMMIPFNPTMLWMGTIVGSELNTTVKQTAQVALTSLCESCLIATAAISITLFLIHNQEKPVWQLCLEVVSDLEGPYFSANMVAMAKYMHYLFNLQHNIARTIM